jgi:RNA polymerase sigma factor for flagellar operon FliA
MYRTSRAISEAIEAFERREGRLAQDADVARELGVELEQYHRMLGDVASGQVVSIEDLVEEGDASAGFESDEEPPDARVERASLRRALAEAITTLPEREQQVLSLYYVEELNLQEIGEVLG